MGSAGRIEDCRPLTADERALLEWLLDHGFPHASQYASQLSRTSVVSRCSCGCPTINLAVDGKHVDGASDVISDAEGKTPEGLQVGVILHGRGGLLSELEVYPIEDPPGPFGLPHPDCLVSLADN